MDKISICIPTYNQKNYIAQAIEGCLMQKNCDFEIIIANDGSTDGTTEICEFYRSKYPEKIKIINQKYNVGLIKNTRDCLYAASGNYIAICEGDDYWIDEYKIFKQLEILKRDKNISLVHTNWIDLFQETLKSEKHQRPPGNDYLCENNSGIDAFLELLNNRYKGIRFSSIMFRSDILNTINNFYKDFFSENFSTVDIGFFYILSYYGKVYSLNDFTTVYRVQSNSVSINKDLEKHILYQIGVMRSKCYFMNKFGVEQNIISNFIRKNSGPIINYIFRLDKYFDSSLLLSFWKDYNYKPKWSHSLLIYIHRNKILNKIFSSLIFKFLNYKHMF